MRPGLALLFLASVLFDLGRAEAAGPTDSARLAALEAHGSGWINVKEPPFNARGDGVADDTAAIQAAIDALPPNGGTIYVPPGTYKLTASVTTTKPGVHLLGASRPGLFGASGASTLMTNAAIWMVQFGTGGTQHSGPVIENLAFSDAGHIALGGVRLLQQNHARVTNSGFFGFTAGSGLQIEGGSDASILPMVYGTNFIGNHSGIKTTGLVTGLHVIGGFFVPGGGGYPPTASDAIGLDYTGDTALVTSNFDGWPVAIRFNVPGNDWALQKVIGSRFEGNTIAIKFLDGSGSSVVANNAFYNAGVGTAVELNGSSGYHVIRDNSYGGTKPLTDNTSGRFGLRTDALGPDVYTSTVRRNTDGVVLNSLEHTGRAYGDDSVYEVRANRGSLIGTLRTNFKSAESVQVGAKTQDDVEIISNGVVVGRFPKRTYGPGNVGLLISANKTGTGYTLEQVTVGPADSGGAGYRVLRVAN